MPLRVLIADELAPEGIDLLRSEAGLEVDVHPGLSPDELADAIAPYDALIVRSATKVTSEVIARAARLRVIGRAGVGLDNVDVEAATKRGVIAMNVPGGNTIAAAEHTMALILAAARRVPQADEHVRAGLWKRSRFLGVELLGKTLGIVGLGKIGVEIARRAQAFGMRVVAFDPYLPEERARRLEVPLVTMESLLADADVVTIHTPITAQTRKMIGEAELARMKSGAILVNCARGGIVDEAALAAALTGRRLAAAALDVFEHEPLETDSPLRGAPNLVMTPHLAASTEEAQRNVAVEIARQVADTLLDRGIRNAVNMPSLDEPTLRLMQPYILLGERLGMLAAQIAGGKASEVELAYVGELANHDTTPVTLAALKGILLPVVGESVNYVNAAVLAAERGLKVVESRTASTGDYVTSVSLRLRGDGEGAALEGTLSARSEPRVVRIDGFAVDAVPSGHLLVIRSVDRPGLIGAIGTTLGEAAVNIAGMTNGRDRSGGNALTVLNLDSPVAPDALDRLRAIPGIVRADLIRL